MARSVQQQVKAKEREAACLRGRLEGKTFEEIAKEVGYASPSAALKAYRRALDRLNIEDAETAWRLQLDRLEAMLLALWPKIEEGDGRAISAGLEIVKQISRLYGLDQPRRTPTPTKEPPGVLVITLPVPERIGWRWGG